MTRARAQKPADPWGTRAPSAIDPWRLDHDQAPQERALAARLLIRPALLLLRDTLSARDFAIFCAVTLHGAPFAVVGHRHRLSRERARAIVQHTQRRLRRLYASAAAYEASS